MLANLGCPYTGKLYPPVQKATRSLFEPGGYLDVGVCPSASARFDYSGVLEE